MDYTIVCISSYFKGSDFMIGCKELGNKIILITSDRLKEENWPWDSIDEVYYMPEIKDSVWNLDHLIKGFAYLMKIHQIDAIAALDDYDVEKAALIRETFRIAGMGQTTHRYFRDKLAMRQKALDCEIPVPSFTSVFNDQKIEEYISTNPAPWVLKPRSEASATGIQKIFNPEQLWEVLEKLGEERIHYLLESFKPGDVYHVDSLIYQSKIVFTSYSKYLDPPMRVTQEGGIFRSITLGPTTKEAKELKSINRDVVTKFGLLNGATHSEFIRGKDGSLYFLETASRVGGAHIADMVMAASGVNIWKEWAKIENAVLDDQTYKLNVPRQENAGLLITLTHEKNPDTSPFQCDQVDHFISKDYHLGIVYRDKKANNIKKCLDDAAEILTNNQQA